MIEKGTPIAVVAPCSAYTPSRLESGLQILRDRGHDPRPFPDLESTWRYLAGDDDHRAAHLIEALTSDAYGAVWIVRGGAGLGRILDRLPYAQLKPRPVIGFSDVTSLFAALDGADDWPLIHGPVVHSLANTDNESLDHLFDLLAGRPTPALRGETWVSGEASGPLVGGNLCVLGTTCGTPWQLEARGAILMLEEIGEYAYRVDRLLQQLASAGVFDGIAGVAVGQFSSCRVPDGADYTIKDILLDHLGRLGVPVLGNLPIGHTEANRAFPWRAPATIADGKLSW